MTADSTPGVNRQPMTSQQIRIAVLVVLAVVVGVVLWLVLGRSTKNHPKSFKTIGPIAFSAKNLKEESHFIHTRFFWAGPQNGDSYEFFRNTKGWLYVRYLPHGVHVGAKGAHYLIVVTYPFPGGFNALKKQAGSSGVPGANGSIVYQRPNDKRSVLVAFPGADYQVEVFDPSPAIALSTARSNKIKLIG